MTVNSDPSLSLTPLSAAAANRPRLDPTSFFDKNLISNIAAIRDLTGTAPRGWKSPGLTETFETLDHLAAPDIEHVCDWCLDDQPVTLKTASGPLVSIPYTVEVSHVVLSVQGHPSDEIYKRGVDQFDRLYREGATNPRVMAIAIHPYLTGASHRNKYLEMLYDHILSHDEEALLTGSKIRSLDNLSEVRRCIT